MTNDEILMDESKWADDRAVVDCKPVDLFIDFYWVEPTQKTQEENKNE